MMRVVVLALLLAGCATTAPRPIAVLPDCPPRPAALKPPPRVRTVPALLRFEVALELLTGKHSATAAIGAPRGRRRWEGKK